MVTNKQHLDYLCSSVLVATTPDECFYRVEVDVYLEWEKILLPHIHKGYKYYGGLHESLDLVRVSGDLEWRRMYE